MTFVEINTISLFSLYIFSVFKEGRESVGVSCVFGVLVCHGVLVLFSLIYNLQHLFYMT